MHDWEPFFILPNVKLTEAIEGGLAVLAPPDNPRVQEFSQAHEKFGLLLERFTDAFGKRLKPTVLLLRSDAPKIFRDISTLTSFRDLVSVAVIGYNRAIKLRAPYGGHRVVYSDAFALYPWMLATDNEHLSGSTPAFKGLHDVSKFHGQSVPGLSHFGLHPFAIDKPLLQSLLVRWRGRYESETPDHADVALFRSLNMVYHASRLPEDVSPNAYDLGRIISLWVSAFEILVHPGGNGKANLGKVFDLIEQVGWVTDRCKRQEHVTEYQGKRAMRTFASRLYQAIYRCRCEFLHGNEVSDSSLLLEGSGPHLFNYTAPLYRLALTAFLPIVPEQGAPFVADEDGDIDTGKYGSFFEQNTSVFEPQSMYEEAILTAVVPPATT